MTLYAMITPKSTVGGRLYKLKWPICMSYELPLTLISSGPLTSLALPHGFDGSLHKLRKKPETNHSYARDEVD